MQGLKDQERPVSMKEYVDMQILGVQKEIMNMKESISAAVGPMDKRLDSMNEFRATLKDQGATFSTKDEVRLTTERLTADIKNLEIAKAKLEGKASQNSFYIAIVFSLIGAIAGITSMLR